MATKLLTLFLLFRLSIIVTTVIHIPFLTLTEYALTHTVVALDGTDHLPVSFAARLQEWSEDPRGMSTFTVPFDGFLDHLISEQVAHLASGQAA